MPGSEAIFQGKRILGTQEFRNEVSVIGEYPPQVGYNLDLPIIRYMGTSENPQWMDEEEGRWINSRFSSEIVVSEVKTDKYETLSRVRVDVARVPYTVEVSRSSGAPVFVQDFEVIHTYGETAEIKAQVAWKEKVCVLRIYLSSHN